MKKVASMLLVCVLLVACVASLASCAKTLSGSYAATVEIPFVGESTTTYSFDGNEVTQTNKVGNTTTEVGTWNYEITTNEDGEDVIIFSSTNDDGETTKTEYSFGQGTEDGKKYIKIGSTQYFLVK